MCKFFLNIDQKNMNFSPKMSGMAVLSSDDNLWKGGKSAECATRKHILYQSCLVQHLVKIKANTAFVDRDFS